MERCPWSGTDPLYVAYHDEEWGNPVHDDGLHFEFLLLETQQAGLSWITILRKREHYRRAFDGFDASRIARYGERDIERLLDDPGIVRNRRKIEGAIRNARSFLEVQEREGSFDRWLWSYVGGEVIINRPRRTEDIPVTTPLSDLVARDLKARGFAFVGSTTIYAHLQAVGLVNDHLAACFRAPPPAATRRPRSKKEQL